MRQSFYILALFCCALVGEIAYAKRHAADLFCKSYPEAPNCAGTAISCQYCHNGAPPDLNPFGGLLVGRMAESGLTFPETEDEFRALMDLVADVDLDGDGVVNGEELKAGTLPADKSSYPRTNICPEADPVCLYDFDHAYTQIQLTVCGEPADYETFKAFQALPNAAKTQELDALLDDCVDSENWLGKNGVVWEIGHYKIRPVGSIKSGGKGSRKEDPGLLEIVDFYNDYNIFVYTQIDGNDARDVLLADYTVERDAGAETTYEKREPDRLDDDQPMQPEYRVGLVSTFWNLGFYLNYTPVARVLVAQAFNAYLGLDLSVMQGMNPPPREASKYADYDLKGIERQECAMCHETIDAAAYPFRNYNGLTGTTKIMSGEDADGLKNKDQLGDENNLTPLSYSLARMGELEERYPGISKMPEAGYVLGQRVETLREWAEVVANSDQFAANTVKDYWQVLVGHAPLPEENEEFKATWRAFKTHYDVERMLHDIIRTRAFGVP